MPLSRAFRNAPPSAAHLPATDDYPFSLVQPIGERRGHHELLTPASPAAGSDFVLTVDPEADLRPVSVVCHLATSAVVGTRTVALYFEDREGAAFCVAGAPLTVSEASAVAFCWQTAAGSSEWPVAGFAVAPLPPLVLYATHRLAIRVGSMDAGDQLSQVRLYVERFPIRRGE